MRAVVTILVLALGAVGFGKAFAEPVAAPANPSTPSDLVIGDYKLVRVVDGDTVRVQGLDSSLRLLGIDTEETFKHDKERRAYAKGWASYTKAARGSSPRPAKFATPLGDAAKTWAEQWFAGVDKVRLERDDPHEIKDRYRRYLAYVLAEKHGKWLNYNVEAVRAGMSPYFPKYGRSRRFDRDFIAAEAEAKAAKRGIWAAGVEAYPDYPEREAWWTARGDFVAAFHKEAASAKHATMIDLTHDDAPALLEANVGHEVIVLGTVGEIELAGTPSHEKPSRHHGDKGHSRAASATDARAADHRADDVRAADDGVDRGESSDGWAGDPDGIAENGDPATVKATKIGPARTGEAADTDAAGVSESRPRVKGPSRVILDNHTPLVFFDPAVLAQSGVQAWKGEWIRVTAKPALYHGRLELVIDRTAQVELCPVPGLTKPSNHEKTVPIHAP